MITIPLTGGEVNAHQIQSILLGDNFLEFSINWITRFEQWTMDIRREGVTLAAGVMLLPGQDVIESYRLDIGKLYFVGDEPTLDNLGQANKLVYVDG